MALSMCVLFCDYHHHLVPELSHNPKLKLHTHFQYHFQDVMGAETLPGLHRAHTEVSRVGVKISGCSGENNKEAENCVLMTGVDTERGTRG